MSKFIKAALASTVLALVMGAVQMRQRRNAGTRANIVKMLPSPIPLVLLLISGQSLLLMRMAGSS
jgi:hypothetical protein